MSADPSTPLRCGNLAHPPGWHRPCGASVDAAPPYALLDRVYDHDGSVIGYVVVALAVESPHLSAHPYPGRRVLMVRGYAGIVLGDRVTLTSDMLGCEKVPR